MTTFVIKLFFVKDRERVLRASLAWRAFSRYHYSSHTVTSMITSQWRIQDLSNGVSITRRSSDHLHAKLRNRSCSEDSGRMLEREAS